MFNLFKKKELFKNPINGTIITIEQVPDPVFAEKMMGEGYGIIPAGDTIYAPFSGTVTVLMESKHAVGITTPSGEEVLIHIGIDSVHLNGQGFETLVSLNDKVSQGDPLVKVNFNYLKENCKSEIVVVLLPKATQVKVNNPNASVTCLEENCVTIA